MIVAMPGLEAMPLSALLPLDGGAVPARRAGTEGVRMTGVALCLFTPPDPAFGRAVRRVEERHRRFLGRLTPIKGREGCPMVSAQ